MNKPFFLVYILFFVGCAAIAITDPPELSRRTLRISREKPELVYSYWKCVKKVVLCVKKELAQDRYDLTNQETRNKLADMGFVATVLEHPTP